MSDRISSHMIKAIQIAGDASDQWLDIWCLEKMTVQETFDFASMTVAGLALIMARNMAHQSSDRLIAPIAARILSDAEGVSEYMQEIAGDSK